MNFREVSRRMKNIHPWSKILGYEIARFPPKIIRALIEINLTVENFVTFIIKQKKESDNHFTSLISRGGGGALDLASLSS